VVLTESQQTHSILAGRHKTPLANADGILHPGRHITEGPGPRFVHQHLTTQVVGPLGSGAGDHRSSIGIKRQKRRPEVSMWAHTHPAVIRGEPEAIGATQLWLHRRRTRFVGS